MSHPSHRRASSDVSRMTRTSRLLQVATISMVMMGAGSAHADVSSWLFVGGGAHWLSEQKSGYEIAPAMQLDLGLGTPPSGPVSLDLTLRSRFWSGTDLPCVAGHTREFSSGGFGLALAPVLTNVGGAWNQPAPWLLTTRRPLRVATLAQRRLGVRRP